MKFLSKLFSPLKSSHQKGFTAFSHLRNLKVNFPLQKSRSVSGGFTLIELLVVIGILGILAAALVATIDPFEQLKKANDANIKNTAVEFINANIRYYTTHNSMPWTNGCNASANPSGATLWPGGMTDCLQSLIGDGELQQAFTTVTGVLTSIIVTGDAQSVTACFQPASRAQRDDQNTRWDKYGATVVAGCPNATSTACYWCSE